MKFLSIVALSLCVLAVSSGAEKKFGKKITLKEKTKISDIIANPEKYHGKKVLVEGPITDVCKMRGCWIKLGSDKEFETMTFKVEDGVIVFPMDIKGKTAAVDLGALYGGNYTVILGGTHPEFPGIAKVINMHHIEFACENKLSKVDFLCGDFHWKKLWHLDAEPLYMFMNPENWFEEKPDLALVEDFPEFINMRQAWTSGGSGSPPRLAPRSGRTSWLCCMPPQTLYGVA